MESRDCTDAGALLEGSELSIHSSVNNNKFKISRPVYTQHEFDFIHGGNVDKLSWKRKLSEKANRYRNRHFSKTGLRTFFVKRFPCISIMGKYKWRQWLMADLIAGLILGVMHIPQSMAYAMLAGLDPMYGLYVSFYPAIIYFFFGTSRHNSIGTIAIISLLSGKFLDRSLLEFPLNLNSSTENETSRVTEGQMKASRAAGLTFCVGIVQFLMSIFQLGFLTRYLSDPLISGFTVGAAIHVFTSQIPSCFGIKIPKQYGIFKIPKSYYFILKNLWRTNLATFVITIICVTILIITKEFINPRVVKKILVPIPIELVVVIFGTVASSYLNLNTNFSVKIVGHIAKGLPSPALPDLSNISNFMDDILITAIIAFSICVSLGKIFAKKNGYTIDANQECFAYGVVNIFSSFFLCYTSAASLSRSAVQDSIGGKTQLTSIVASILLLFVLLFIGPLFYALPQCILSSIIVVALKGMFMQFTELKELWIFSYWDFGTWVITFLMTMFLNIEYGLMIGVGISILTVMLRTQNPKSHILGQIVGTDLYKNLSVYDQCKEVAGVKIFRYEGSLYYACSDHFRKSLYSKIGYNPRVIVARIAKLELKLKKLNKKFQDSDDVKAENDLKIFDGHKPLIDKKKFLSDELARIRNVPIHHIIIDCSTWGYIDFVGVKTLHQIIEEYKSVNVIILLANPKTDIREMFARSKCYKVIDDQIIYVSVHDAVINSIFDYKLKCVEAMQAEKTLV